MLYPLCRQALKFVLRDTLDKVSRLTIQLIAYVQQGLEPNRLNPAVSDLRDICRRMPSRTDNVRTRLPSLKQEAFKLDNEVIHDVP